MLSADLWQDLVSNRLSVSSVLSDKGPSELARSFVQLLKDYGGQSDPSAATTTTTTAAANINFGKIISYFVFLAFPPKYEASIDYKNLPQYKKATAAGNTSFLIKAPVM